jgi:hypothetical protein
LHRFVFCLELAELGAPPAVQLRLVAELWDRRVQRIFQDAEAPVVRPPSGDDIVLLMVGTSLMIEAWAGAVPNVQHCPLRKLVDRVQIALEGSDDPDDELPPRVLAVNLTARLRRFHSALAAVHFKFPQPPIPATDSAAKRHEPKVVQTGRRGPRGKERTGRRRHR